jgi:hypothetical protein
MAIAPYWRQMGSMLEEDNNYYITPLSKYDPAFPDPRFASDEG